jgi:hypothetical protein
MIRLSHRAALLVGAALALASAPAHASLYSLAASGTVSVSTEASIPVGTPWSFEVIYDTAAPDLAPADPTFGSFDNSGTPATLTSFHYQAGSYEVAVADSANFGLGSDILITFTSVHAIDLNINAPALFPPLDGGAVRFHADFNDFSSRPIFVSDGLPTDPALGPDKFDAITVSLLPASGEVSGGSLTSFVVSAVPEPSILALAIAGLPLLVAARARGVTGKG